MSLPSSLRAATTGFSDIARNQNLRRIELALAGWNTCDAAFTVALAVFAYRVGGTTAVGIVGLITLLPTAVTVPFGASFADRHERERVLLAVSLVSAAAVGGCCAAYYLDPSEALIFVLATIQASVSMLFWPVATALLPSLATTPGQLIAANGVASTIEGLGMLVGPLVAGVLIATTEPGAVFGLVAVVYLWVALLLVRLRVEGRVRLGTDPPGRQLLIAFRVLAEDREALLIGALFCCQTFVRGLLNVLIVVTAFQLLHAGGGWVGYLTAAMGVGGLVGGFGGLTLTGRRLAVPFALGLLAWGIPIALLAAGPYRVSALLLLAVVGAGNAIEDISGETLLQRLVDDHVLARVTGLLFGVAMAIAGLGSILAPGLVSILGTRGALVATGCLLPLLVLASSRRLRRIDALAAAPLPQLELLEAIPMFTPLPVAAKEQVAARLEPVTATSGETIVREGDLGDRFYVVVTGHVEVTQGNRQHGERGPGDYFGEIALLRDVPRTATVTACEDVELRSLERDAFLAAVTGHPRSRDAADEIVAERLANVGIEPR